MNGINVLGHMPRKIPYICCIFLLHSGSITCRVTRPRQCSQDNEQGRLQVSCEYIFFLKEGLKKAAGDSFVCYIA